MSLVGTSVAEGGRADALRLVGAVEHASEHPVAQAPARAAAERSGALPAVEGFANREGLGVEGAVEGRALVVGRPALLADRGIELPPALERARSKPNGTARPRWPPDRVARARALRRGGHRQAQLGGGRRPPPGPRPAAGAAHGRQHRHRPRGRRAGGDRGGGGRGAARGQGGRGAAPPGGGTRGRDGRRRRERRAGACAGRSRAVDRDRHRRRDRGQRPHPRLGRSAWRGRRDPPLARHPADDQTEPRVGLRLQRRRAAAGGGRPPETR